MATAHDEELKKSEIPEINGEQKSNMHRHDFVPRRLQNQMPQSTNDYVGVLRMKNVRQNTALWLRELLERLEKIKSQIDETSTLEESHTNFTKRWRDILYMLKLEAIFSNFIFHWISLNFIGSSMVLVAFFAL